ncbi:hypothetical protein PTSG_10733 [Salpingoeca rosetta]|uniref:Uncharacterized protein n=1 Tax=Salpingoeca rosetta (strain ATCC 50818 / BSB-021) TaxID=946362 RepID=F2UQ81_SALR5|nr:uncharacterized protein PTSG_10733 [Salpingoeca rosetta]EGD79749.1 hypothetical protein PTSG_10733 [Salpingoeca rosetta]|eukprot:XP_004988698.1 hypothetical protein PTSG_10733 [Salpingoeca rosetta]
MAATSNKQASMLPSLSSVSWLLVLVVCYTTFVSSHAQTGEMNRTSAFIYVDENRQMILQDSEARLSLKDMLETLSSLQQTVSTLQRHNAELRSTVSTLESQATASVAFTRIAAITTAGTYDVTISINNSSGLPSSVPLYAEVGGAGGGGASPSAGGVNGASTSLVCPSMAMMWLKATGGVGGDYLGPGGAHGSGDIGPIRLVGRGGDGGVGGGGSAGSYRVPTISTGVDGGNGGYAAGVFQLTAPVQQLQAVVGAGGRSADRYAQDGSDGFVIFHYPQGMDITITNAA